MVKEPSDAKSVERTSFDSQDGGIIVVHDRSVKNYPVKLYSLYSISLGAFHCFGFSA